MTNEYNILDQPGPLKDWYFEVGENNVQGKGFLHKFGRVPDIDPADGFITIWNGAKGNYTGFDATAAEIIEYFSSSANDAGALVSNGTVTGGSNTTLEDTGATFVSDGVIAGDIVLNDTDKSHGIILSLTETILTVRRFDKGGIFTSKPIQGDSYRVATTASTGAAVLETSALLDGNLANETSEFIILNGLTGVDTGESYRRNAIGSILLAGSNGSNIGTITGRQKVTIANIFMVMPIGYNRTMIVAYTLPADQEGHILSIFAALTGKVSAISTIRLKIRHEGEVFTVQEEFSIGASGSSYIQRNFTVPKNSLSPGADLFMEADTDTNNTQVTAGFDLIKSTD